MFFSRKCPYCGGKNLYLKRTSPVEQYGCRDCEKEIKYLKECGVPEDRIKTLFNNRKRAKS